jgi:hypothetical protein
MLEAAAEDKGLVELTQTAVMQLENLLPHFLA